MRVWKHHLACIIRTSMRQWIFLSTLHSRVCLCACVCVRVRVRQAPWALLILSSFSVPPKHVTAQELSFILRYQIIHSKRIYKYICLSSKLPAQSNLCSCECARAYDRACAHTVDCLRALGCASWKGWHAHTREGLRTSWLYSEPQNWGVNEKLINNEAISKSQVHTQIIF